MKNKYETLITTSIVLLIICFTIKLIGTNFINEIIQNEKTINIYNYIKTSIIFYTFDFILFYLCCYNYYKAILRVKKFEGKMRYLHLLLVCAYLSKLLVNIFIDSNLEIFFNLLIQAILFVPLFCIFKTKYTKVSSEQNFIRYILNTIILFSIVCSLTLHFYISFIFISLLSYIMIDALYYIDDYLQHLRAKKIKIEYGMDENELIEKCNEYKLTPLETNVLVMFYCRKMKRYEIGFKLGYSEDNISKIKSKALSKFA